MDIKQKSLQLTGANYKGDRRPLDFYPTPPEATIALMNFLKLEKCIIWECACGNNAMVDVLKNYNHGVIATDINTGHDFLKTEIKCDAIITNPPFFIAEDFIKKATQDANIVAFLLKGQYWHAKKRFNLFNENKPSYIYYP